MKTIFSLVIISAVCSGTILALDFEHRTERGISERREYAARCDAYNTEQQDGVRVSTEGRFADTLVFQLDGVSDTERDYLISETLFGMEKAEDQNFRMVLRRMRFTHLRVGNRTVEVPKAEPVNPPVGTRELDYGNAGNG